MGTFCGGSASWGGDWYLCISTCASFCTLRGRRRVYSTWQYGEPVTHSAVSPDLPLPHKGRWRWTSDIPTLISSAGASIHDMSRRNSYNCSGVSHRSCRLTHSKERSVTYFDPHGSTCSSIERRIRCIELNVWRGT